MDSTRLRHGLRHTVVVLLAMVTGIAGLVVSDLTVTRQAANAASSFGGSITRAEVISRAKDGYSRRWDSDMTYSQASTAVDVDGDHSYRRDCSGYVSMAWHVSSTGLNAPDTSALATGTWTTSISRSDLKPGDILDDISPSESTHHTVIFAGWSSDRTTFSYYSFGSTPLKFVTAASFSDSELSGHPTSHYNAYRYKNIIDGSNGTATGDYNNNGVTDMALYRQDSTNGSSWWVYSTHKAKQFLGGYTFGGCNDIPATAT